ncbi:MAG: arylamine N-acetyltransferase [Bacteroidota bacterium]
MDVSTYFRRINYQGSTQPTLATLQALQLQHLLNVPFENLDIHRGVEIRMDLEHIYQKVIVNRRGGWCFELNGLFYLLLQRLGFEVRRISSRVYNEDRDFLGPELDHLATIVSIDGREYLSDVGFGKFTAGPLLMQTDLEQTDRLGTFYLKALDETTFDVFLKGHKDILQYRLDQRARDFQEFAPMCHYLQTSPDSHFTQKRLASLMLPNGRVTLTGDELKITHSGSVQTTKLKDEMAIQAALQHHFGIVLD